MPNLKKSQPLAWVQLDSQALRGNIEFLNSLHANSKNRPLLCAAVKANAYGHGLSEVVTLLKNLPVDYLAVHSVEEAQICRKLKWRKPILAVGYIELNQVDFAVQLNIEPTLYNVENLNAFESAGRKQKKTVSVHVKVETGANRQGATLTELKKLVYALKSCKHVTLKGLSTHFANIEDTTDHSFAKLQLGRFEQALNIVKKAGLSLQLRHTAASAAHLVMPETRFDMIRAGISLYGHWPSKETIVSFKHTNPGKNGASELQPVMSLKARIAQIKKIKAGETVGYGLTYTARRAMTIAIVPIGYYDGIVRALSNVGHALINGKHAQIVGRVSMNNTALDVTEIRGVTLEDTVTFIGRDGKEKVSIEDYANWSGTINYEALTRIGAHLPRIVT